MKFIVLLVALSGVFVATHSTALAQNAKQENRSSKSEGKKSDGDKLDDQKQLEGQWTVVSMKMGGKTMKPTPGAPDAAEVKKGVISFSSGGKLMSTFRDLKIEIDTSAKPKTMDLKRKDRGTLPCIYKVDKKSLVIMMPMAPARGNTSYKMKRPKSFDATDATAIVLTLQRKEKK